MSADARLGLTRRQLRAAVRIEAGLVAVFGGLFGIAGGYLLGTLFQRAALRTGLLDATVPAGQLLLTLAGQARPQDQRPRRHRHRVGHPVSQHP